MVLRDQRRCGACAPLSFTLVGRPALRPSPGRDAHHTHQDEANVPYGLRVDTWYDYRTVWSAHPWVLLVFVIAVVCVIAGVIGTVATNVLAIAFIPGLLLGYGHHLIVTRKYG